VPTSQGGRFPDDATTKTKAYLANVASEPCHGLKDGRSETDLCLARAYQRRSLTARASGRSRSLSKHDSDIHG
jgi:hypothetical protein